MVHKKGSWKRAFEWVGEIVGVFHESWVVLEATDGM